MASKIARLIQTQIADPSAAHRQLRARLRHVGDDIDPDDIDVPDFYEDLDEGFAPDEDDEYVTSSPGSEMTRKMELQIRAGKYKPKRRDPWAAHFLYNALKDMRQI